MAADSGEECGLVLIDITERKRLEGELRSFASRMFMMEENFRKKIAMELHNDICCDLTVLGMNATSIVDGIKEVAPPKLTTKAKDSARLIKEINRTIRNIMDGLSPPVLEDYGLPAALRWHASLFSKRSGIPVLFLISEPFPRLTADQEMTLFRISQEALMSISKRYSKQRVIGNRR